MSSSATCGFQMVMVVSVVLVESFVLTPTSGQHTTEMTQIYNRGGGCQMAWELRFNFP